jgi:hypothetical protein
MPTPKPKPPKRVAALEKAMATTPIVFTLIYEPVAQAAPLSLPNSNKDSILTISPRQSVARDG